MEKQLEQSVCTLRAQLSAPHTDPTQTVDFENPEAVVAAINALMCELYGKGYGLPTLKRAVADLVRAFRGDYPDLLRCDTHYHDLRHAFDSGLAMARLLQGHSRATGSHERIDCEHALLGILLALYHDIGLLRRNCEAHMQGAQLTPIHEARGVEFMREYLTRTPLAHLAGKAELIMVTQLVWRMPSDFAPLDRSVASLLGTADLLSQLSDRAYLEKCRDFLFAEFSSFGLAGAPGLPYPDSEALLKKTPAFYCELVRQRIAHEYGGADRYLQVVFGDDCPYQAAIRRNFDYLESILEKDDLSLLRRTPRRIVDARQ